MSEYVVYQQASGAIVSANRCNEGSMPPEGPVEGTGLSILHGVGDPATHQVVSGAIVPRSAADIATEAEEQAWFELRARRNALLEQTQWTQGADAPFTEAQKASWATYRQQLRDLPANTTDPTNPTWPTPPAV